MSFARAAEELAAREPVIARLRDEVGPPKVPPPQRTPFDALTRAICFQQLSGRAAATIYGRFEAAVGGAITPAAVLSTPPEQLRAAGLSGAKTASVLDLAAKVADGTVPLDDVRRSSDEALIERLVVVRGIGRWTAEMFLIFQLRRLDVWPVDDLGVRHGYGLAWRLDQPPRPKELTALGERFRPYRSVVARYCWEAVALSRGGTDPSLR